MYRIPEVNRIWQEMRTKIVDQGENVNLGELERLFDRAIQAQDSYSSQMAIKRARGKGPYGAWI